VKIVPLFGSGIAGKSQVITAQRRLNVYLENREDGDKTKIAVIGTPGLQLSFSPGTNTLPMRAMAGDANNLYACQYNQLLLCNPTALTSVNVGTLLSFSGLCSMAVSPTQVVIADGDTGYVYNIVTNTFTTLTSGTTWPAVGARTVTYVGGFFVAEQPGTQAFWVSNAFDGSTWGALSTANAASTGDTILAVDNLSGNLIIFMQQAMEYWQNVGASPQPFQPVLSAFNQWGLGAIFSRAHVDQSLIFLAVNTNGTAQVVKANFYSVTVISTSDLESIINNFSTFSDGVALTYQVGKHPMYQLTFPTGNRSFLYDNSTGVWSEVQTGTSVTPTRHWGNLSTWAAGFNFISDYAMNQLYQMNPNVYTDNNQTIIRQIITRHVLSQFNRVRISLLYLDMETGVGLQIGQGSNPQIMLRSSKDNGRTWSAERWAPLGKVGFYLWRVIWRRFGSARDYVFSITMSDPVKFVITEGAIKLSERQPAEKLG
jgi:Phage stabilisation protein